MNTVFKLFSAKFASKTDGGILAIYDATIPNQGAIESRSAYTYSNLAKIHPCVREEINIYLDDETLILR